MNMSRRSETSESAFPTLVQEAGMGGSARDDLD